MKARPGARGELLVTVGRRRRFSPESSPADLTTLRPSSRQHARTPGACLEIPAPTIEAATTAPVRACRGGEMYFFRRRPASPSILCRVLLRTGAHQCSSRGDPREVQGDGRGKDSVLRRPSGPREARGGVADLPRTQQRGVALCDLGAAPLLPPGAAAQRSHLRGGMSGEYYFRQTDPRGGHQPPPLQDRPSGGGTGRPAKLCSSRGFVRGGKQDKGTRAADTRLNREYRSGYAIFSGKCSGGCPKEAEVPPPPMRQRTPRGSPMPRPRRAPRPRMQALATGGGGR